MKKKKNNLLGFAVSATVTNPSLFQVATGFTVWTAPRSCSRFKQALHWQCNKCGGPDSVYRLLLYQSAANETNTQAVQILCSQAPWGATSLFSPVKGLSPTRTPTNHCSHQIGQSGLLTTRTSNNQDFQQPGFLTTRTSNNQDS